MRHAIVLVGLLGCRRERDAPTPPPPPATARAAPALAAQVVERDPPLAPGEGTMVVERTSATTAKVSVMPGRGFHMNPDYPWKLVLSATPGLAFKKTTLRGKDAEVLDEHQLAIAVEFSRTDPSVHAIRGRLDLAVCERDRCLPRSMPIAVTID